MKPIAFFCAEYGIEEKLPLYAGGLGILSGDFIREAGDQNVPLIAVGLYYSGGVANDKKDTLDIENHILTGYGFHQVEDGGGKTLIITVDVKNAEPVKAKVWTRKYGSANLYLIDTDVEDNAPAYRDITTHLYDSDKHKQMFQEFVLGVGGVKLLRALKIDPAVYHLNEGHTSFVVLALVAEYMHDHREESSFINALNIVRPKIVASKHTILPAAGLYLEKETLRTLVGPYIERHRIDFEEFFKLGVIDTDPNIFSTTKFLLVSAVRSNGVSVLHTVFEHERHPKSPLIPITNGVYIKNWRSPLWNNRDVHKISNPELWKLRLALKAGMLNRVKEWSGVELDPEVLTIVWARRFAAYKRPGILFSDPGRLASIVSDLKQPIQFIISGVAHNADPVGMAAVNEIKKSVVESPFKGKIVYIPSYSISVARELVSGADVWLNTPERGVEACGTSGMKAGLNGALMASISDGWIEEVDWSEMGWILPNENTANGMYDIIEHSIKPLFYKRNDEGVPEEWLERIKKTVDVVSCRFSSERMIKDYIDKLYYPEADTA